MAESRGSLLSGGECDHRRFWPHTGGQVLPVPCTPTAWSETSVHYPHTHPSSLRTQASGHLPAASTCLLPSPPGCWAPFSFLWISCHHGSSIIPGPDKHGPLPLCISTFDNTSIYAFIYSTNTIERLAHSTYTLGGIVPYPQMESAWIQWAEEPQILRPQSYLIS